MHSLCLQWMKELLQKTANCPLLSQHWNCERGERRGPGAGDLQWAYDLEYLIRKSVKERELKLRQMEFHCISQNKYVWREHKGEARMKYAQLFDWLWIVIFEEIDRKQLSNKSKELKQEFTGFDPHWHYWSTPTLDKSFYCCMFWKTSY